MKPIIAITMGDPSGNGPELCIKALYDNRFYDKADVVVIGDYNVLDNALSFPNMPKLKFNRISDIDDALFEKDVIDVYDLGIFSDIGNLKIGKVDALSGLAAFLSVKKAIELAMEGKVDATVTNALNKEAMNKALKETDGKYSDAKTHFDGHTEIYAYYTKTKSYCMMLSHKDLRVSHVSTHCSLREACDRVKRKRVEEVITLTDSSLKSIGIEKPHIAVAGLNPHAGEHGLFGTEEIEEIIPAIEASRSKGVDCVGPVPPDSVFSEALGGIYDAVVAMYHDQGHIPLKTVGFVYDRNNKCWKAVEGVNITLGLPIIRTSVDHGTGFALAGKGESSAESLINAINMAISLL